MDLTLCYWFEVSDAPLICILNDPWKFSIKYSTVHSNKCSKRHCFNLLAIKSIDFYRRDYRVHEWMSFFVDWCSISFLFLININLEFRINYFEADVKLRQWLLSMLSSFYWFFWAADSHGFLCISSMRFFMRHCFNCHVCCCIFISKCSTTSVVYCGKKLVPFGRKITEIIF